MLENGGKRTRAAVLPKLVDPSTMLCYGVLPSSSNVDGIIQSALHASLHNFMTLQVACLDCVKYDASDPLAKVLALISSAPYLAILYQAAVHHRPVLSRSAQHHGVSLCSHGATDSSMGVASSHFTSKQHSMNPPCCQVVYSRRELHGITTLAGMCLNWPLGGALKRALRQARPAARCQLLGTCHSHGMPSSHTQLMFFAWALHALFAYCGARAPGRAAAPERLAHAAETLFLGLTSCAVAYARVYLGYHDAWQVLQLPFTHAYPQHGSPAVGSPYELQGTMLSVQVVAAALLGTLLAALWYWVTLQLARRRFPTVERWRISDFLRLKDTTMVPSVLQWERQQALRISIPESSHAHKS